MKIATARPSVSLLPALLAALALPAFFQNKSRQAAATCAMQLDAIAAASRQYASEHGRFPATLEALVPLPFKSVPACPSGGTYTLGTPEGDPPTCSIPDHHL